MSTEEGFPDYVPKTNESGLALYALVLVYTSLSFLLIAPLVVWGRQNENKNQQQAENHENAWYRRGANGAAVGTLGHQPTRQDPPLQDSHTQHVGPTTGRPQQHNERAADPNRTSCPDGGSIFRANPSQTPSHQQGRPSRTQTQGGVLTKLDKFVTTSYPDGALDSFSSEIASSVREKSQAPTLSSAATTSRLYCRASHEIPQTRVWDVDGRRWKSRRPIGRPDMIQHAVQMEGRIPTGVAMRQRRRRSSSGSRGSGRSRRSHSRNGSFSSLNTDSILPPVADHDITPNDAADAGDPGRVNSFEQVDTGEEVTVFCGPNALWKPQTIVRGIDGVAELANPDGEMKRILGLGVPLTVGAMSGSMFQAITVSIISQSLGTDSMAAFVLVSLLLEFSDELVGAVADAGSSLCSHSFSLKNMHLTGQYVQLAGCLHFVVFGAIVVFWLCCMDSIVEWLVGSTSIATKALAYTRIALFQHLLQTLSRTFSVLFYFIGSDSFETHADFCEGLVTLIVIASVVESSSGATLETVGWIQVTTAIAAFIAKVVYVISKGSPRPLNRSFWTGMVGSIAFRNKTALLQMVATSVPLLIGTSLEYTEWEILLLFVVRLGPAEVVSWALLGVIWKVLETSTEGIGEAAAVRVAYHLGTENPNMARLSSYKAVFVSVVQSLVVTSVWYMAGKKIIAWLTTDLTLQRILNDVIILVGIGNVVMSYRMISWTLVGAQGRYRLATILNLLSRWVITIPIAAVFVYGLMLDLNATVASVVIGSSTACMALSYVLLRSDWKRLSRNMHDLNTTGESDDESDNEDDDRAGDRATTKGNEHVGSAQALPNEQSTNGNDAHSMRLRSR